LCISITQHVNVAGVECQTCHGPVQEYEIQNNSLIKGWCIDCHRKTEVKMEGMNTTKIHDELSKKYGVDKLTQMGGLECGKCHHY
jgi:hypothetical protein